MRVVLVRSGIILGLIYSAVLVMCCAGCEVSVSATTGGKLFYPNKVGNGDLGDPRRGMYDGSGYRESSGAGSSTGGDKFEGLGRGGVE